MVTELQFVAVAAFLIWGLAASLCGVLTAAPDTARLVRLHRDVEPEVRLPEHASPSIDPSLEVHET
ncbi:MAG TPA: hypothetical protein VMS92_19760 [Mycobacterium sp.]|nr:hypothetical protein [Mycobacterium sp.]